MRRPSVKTSTDNNWLTMRNRPALSVLKYVSVISCAYAEISLNTVNHTRRNYEETSLSPPHCFPFSFSIPAVPCFRVVIQVTLPVPFLPFLTEGLNRDHSPTVHKHAEELAAHACFSLTGTSFTFLVYNQVLGLRVSLHLVFTVFVPSLKYIFFTIVIIILLPIKIVGTTIIIAFKITAAKEFLLRDAALVNNWAFRRHSIHYSLLHWEKSLALFEFKV